MIKIIITDSAIEKFKKLFIEHDEYSCVRIEYNGRCFSKNSFSIIFDEFRSNFVIDNVNSIFIMYDELLSTIIKLIKIDYSNSSFLIKAVPVDKGFTGICHTGCKDCCNETKCIKCNKNCHRNSK